MNLLFKTAFTIAVVLMLHLTVSAQNTPDNNVTDNAKPAQNFYFEVLGPGLIYSFNYDSRFTNRRDGIGGRIGLSYFSDDSNNHNHLFTVPLAINYLLGKRGRFFEMGAGITYYTSNANFIYVDDVHNHQTKSGVFGTMNFGFRLQPADGGFSFRTGFSPIINGDTFAPYWPYVSFGYSF